MAAGPIISVDGLTKEGDCGSLYLGRIGKFWFVRAMHYMLLDISPGSRSVGALLTGRDLTAASARLGSVFQGVFSVPS
jgi:hypothetical protein